MLEVGVVLEIFVAFLLWVVSCLSTASKVTARKILFQLEIFSKITPKLGHGSEPGQFVEILCVC